MAVVTLTVNPAVDLACTTHVVRPYHKIRTNIERIDAGGGGINVARVLRQLGEEATAYIMTGGVTGRLIEQLLDKANVPWRGIRIKGDTRIVINVREDESELEYRFVPAGPEVEAEEWLTQLDALNRIDADWLVASGSVAPGVPDDFYARAARLAHARGTRFALDTSKASLKASLGCGVELLKLSLSELEYLAGGELPDPVSQDEAVLALLAGGAAAMIAVSLGREGALLATGDGIERMPAVPVTVQGAAGAGDSFLAGLVFGFMRGLSPRQALAMAMATGAVAVMHIGTAHVTREEVEALYRRVADPSYSEGAMLC